MTNVEVQNEISKLLTKKYEVSIAGSCMYIEKKGRKHPISCINWTYGNENVLYLKCLKVLKKHVRLSEKRLEILNTYFGMGISCLAYGNYTNETLKSAIERHIMEYSELFDYDLALDIATVMNESVKRVYRNVSTDFEGCSYNSIEFKPE